MNEKIENNLDQIIAYLHEGVKTAGDFVVEQTPLLVQEILTYNLIYHGSLMGLGIFIAVMMISLTLRFWPKIDWDDGDHVMSFLIGSIAGWGLSLGLIFCNIFVVIKIIFAPRLYLLEYISGLIK